ncbi:ATP-binding cassette domain-containing protein, partial [Bordetella pertussis]
MLSLHNVDAGYGGKTVLKSVSLTVPQGAIVTLLGANGAGKSTTLKAIVGLVQPTAGAIELDGAPVG